MRGIGGRGQCKQGQGGALVLRSLNTFYLSRRDFVTHMIICNFADKKLWIVNTRTFGLTPMTNSSLSGWPQNWSQSNLAPSLFEAQSFLKGCVLISYCVSRNVCIKLISTLSGGTYNLCGTYGGGAGVNMGGAFIMRSLNTLFITKGLCYSSYVILPTKNCEL